VYYVLTADVPLRNCSPTHSPGLPHGYHHHNNTALSETTLAPWVLCCLLKRHCP